MCVVNIFHQEGHIVVTRGEERWISSPDKFDLVVRRGVVTITISGSRPSTLRLRPAEICVNGQPFTDSDYSRVLSEALFYRHKNICTPSEFPSEFLGYFNHSGSYYVSNPSFVRTWSLYNPERPLGSQFNPFLSISAAVNAFHQSILDAAKNIDYNTLINYKHLRTHLRLHVYGGNTDFESIDLPPTITFLSINGDNRTVSDSRNSRATVKLNYIKFNNDSSVNKGLVLTALNLVLNAFLPFVEGNYLHFDTNFDSGASFIQGGTNEVPIRTIEFNLCDILLEGAPFFKDYHIARLNSVYVSGSVFDRCKIIRDTPGAFIYMPSFVIPYTESFYDVDYNYAAHNYFFEVDVFSTSSLDHRYCCLVTNLSNYSLLTALRAPGGVSDPQVYQDGGWFDEERNFINNLVISNCKHVIVDTCRYNYTKWEDLLTIHTLEDYYSVNNAFCPRVNVEYKDSILYQSPFAIHVPSTFQLRRLSMMPFIHESLPSKFPLTRQFFCYLKNTSSPSATNLTNGFGGFYVTPEHHTSTYFNFECIIGPMVLQTESIFTVFRFGFPLAGSIPIPNPFYTLSPNPRQNAFLI